MEPQGANSEDGFLYTPGACLREGPLDSFWAIYGKMSGAFLTAHIEE